MKKVFFEPAGKIHPSQFNLINYPPEGYEFVTSKTPMDGFISNSFIFDNIRLQVLDRLMPLTLAKSYIDKYLRPIPKGIDLLYCYNHISPRKIPYVIHIEWANVIVGRDLKWFNLFKKKVEKELQSELCRKILVWSPEAGQSLNYHFDRLEDKIEVIPPAYPSIPPFKKDWNHTTIIILFMGTTFLGRDYIEKGGDSTLQVFNQLRKKHNNIELIIRAKPPRRVERDIPGVTFYDSHIPRNLMERLYQIADILLNPTHLMHNTVPIEAMAYGIPIVGTSMSNYVEDGKTGLVVHNIERLPYFKNNMLTSETTKRSWLIKQTLKTDPKTIWGLVDATSSLIEDSLLRKTLGTQAKAEVDSGRFSIENRNKKLREIFDEATR
ncbi:hypothetical protein LCGC14_0902250 [marine sediment metagenome]|uniref:Glycosyl transferase family 1 domain-containing protein n=1 Tax=marine sediment metagenome TaxID=412755 RepID=A0A0F9NW05_9ZZZZ